MLILVRLHVKTQPFFKVFWSKANTSKLPDLELMFNIMSNFEIIWFKNYKLSRGEICVANLKAPLRMVRTGFLWPIKTSIFIYKCVNDVACYHCKAWKCVMNNKGLQKRLKQKTKKQKKLLNKDFRKSNRSTVAYWYVICFIYSVHGGPGFGSQQGRELSLRERSNTE